MKNSIQDIRNLAARYRLPAWMANKYFLVGAAFAVIILFFDSFNVMERYKLSREMKQARGEMEYYRTEITRISDQLDLLLSDEETLERFAREQYLMKRDGEEIYVILSEDQLAQAGR